MKLSLALQISASFSLTSPLRRGSYQGLTDYLHSVYSHNGIIAVAEEPEGLNVFLSVPASGF